MPEAPLDLVVIGAGPGGYVAAIRAAQLGLQVAVIEREDVLGGTCLRVGCIPSKALLESSERYEEARHSLKLHGVTTGEIGLDLAAMMRRKDLVVSALTKGIDGLFRKNKILRLCGHGRLEGPGRVSVTGSTGTTTLEARHILIATGSTCASLPGVEPDGQRIVTSTGALSFASVPGHLVVIGAGAIGLELGSVWRRLGSRVTVLEYCDRILPGMDSELAAEARKILEKQGLQFRLKTRVTRVHTGDNGCLVDVGDEETLSCDRVLLAAGRRPNTEGLALETVGIQTDERGRIPVDARFATSCPGLHAIGDVIAGPMLAHKAEEEAVAFAEILATGHGHVNYDVIPSIVYTQPEVASVGKSEDELVAAGVAFRKGVFPFMANGRARAIGRTEGRVKILADTATDRVLGVHIVGAHAGDLIAEAATAMSLGARSEDIARACHAHPTLSETLKEAAMAVSGRAIHF